MLMPAGLQTPWGPCVATNLRYCNMLRVLGRPSMPALHGMHAPLGVLELVNLFPLFALKRALSAPICGPQWSPYWGSQSGPRVSRIWPEDSCSKCVGLAVPAPNPLVQHREIPCSCPGQKGATLPFRFHALNPTHIEDTAPVRISERSPLPFNPSQTAARCTTESLKTLDTLPKLFSRPVGKPLSLSLSSAWS